MDKKQLRSNLLLLVMAMIWGSAFVAQSVGMTYIGPFTFTCTRMLLGSAVLLPVIAFKQKKTAAPAEKPKRSGLIPAALICGGVLFIAGSFQQIGIQYTTVAKAGFLTAMYILIVPLLGLFIKKRVSPLVWLCILMALFGVYLLCMNGKFTLQRGDLLCLLGAIGFSFQILCIDYYSSRVDGLRLACMQFFVCGALAFIPMIIFEKPALSSILAAWLPICYAGILACGVAYTFQIYAQRDMHPVIASLIMSLESVFALLSGWLVLGQGLTSRELCGCVLMFAAIIISQLPVRRKEK